MVSRLRFQGDDAVIYCALAGDGRFQILHAFNFGHESSIPMRASSKVSARFIRCNFSWFDTRSDVTSVPITLLLITDCERNTHSVNLPISSALFDSVLVMNVIFII